MLTRRRKALMLEASRVAKEEVKQATLLALPDEALLAVLAYLSPDDLCAAGRAAPRLAELTHAHSSLWRGKPETAKYYFRTVPELLGLVRALPVVIFFRFDVERSPMLVAHFRYEVLSDGVVARKLTLEGPDMKICVQVLQYIKPMYLVVFGIERDLEVLFRTIEDSRNLWIIYLNLASYFSKCDFRWPRWLTLPRLAFVKLTCRGKYFDGVKKCGLDPSLLQTLDSFLQAHSAQLDELTLGSPQTLPLLGSCYSTKTAHLTCSDWHGHGWASPQHLRALKDSLVHVGHVSTDKESSKFCVSEFVLLTRRLWERRDLLCSASLLCMPGTVPAGRHLSFDCDYSKDNFCVLPAVIISSPDLHSLCVLGVPQSHRRRLLESLESFFQVNDKAPEPRVLLLTDVSSQAHYGGLVSSGSLIFNDYDDNCDAYDDDVPLHGFYWWGPTQYSESQVCQNLVRRATVPLHVAVSWSGKGALFFKHPKAAVAGCALCAEATDAVTYFCGPDKKIDELVRVQ